MQDIKKLDRWRPSTTTLLDMRIVELEITNFRTIEHLHLRFANAYTAICGPNDSGKTNVIRAIRAVMRESDLAPFFVYDLEDDDETVALPHDYPKWLTDAPNQRRSSIRLTLSISKERDTALHEFCARQLGLVGPPDELEISLSVAHGGEHSEQRIAVTALGGTYQDLQAEEVLKRVRTSRAILFHNSVQATPYRFRGGLGQLRELTGEAGAVLDNLKKTADRSLKRIAKGQQEELERLLGRLEKKYKVGIALPSYDLSQLPFNVTLGENKFNVSLDNWGSGTQNRTLILLALFRGKQIGDAGPSASKVTPLIVIEEPESFLHPSAQAEFGRVLQDLAEEFGVQVIVTTHSPYMLASRTPTSNILLSRRTAHGQLRETQRVTTDGDNWMEPYGQVLGLRSEEFRPWRELFASDGEAILLVEGETDREYFQLLRNVAHGSNALKFEGDIVPYDGVGNLQNAVLLRFIRNRFKRLFLTFDLDAESILAKTLTSLGLEATKHYMPIGLQAAGKRCIEGLLPDSVHSTVYAANPGLVQAVSLGTSEEQRKAKAALKNLCLAEFKATAVPGDQHFKHLYAVARTINRALS